jgi:hypothetical protein
MVLKRRVLQEKIIAFDDEAPIGTKVVYWPARDKDGCIIFRNGKRTIVRAAARIDKADRCMVILAGIPGLVSIDNVTLARDVLVSDGPCYDDEFNHLW